MNARRSFLVASVLAVGVAVLAVRSLSGPTPGSDEERLASSTGRASNSGLIDVREASITRFPDAWQLDARADIELSRAIRSGLDSGVPLEFVLQFELAESRRFIPNKVVVEAERRYGLVYYELTRHYRVRSLDDGTARNYRSLGTALAGLGRFSAVRFSVHDDAATVAGSSAIANAQAFENGSVESAARRLAARLNPYSDETPLVARLAFRLDGRALPLPLQSPFGSAWRLASAPHEWALPVGGGDAL